MARTRPGIGSAMGVTVNSTVSSIRSSIRNEPAFAMLAGAAPIPASSGRTIRHRLNRRGD